MKGLKVTASGIVQKFLLLAATAFFFPIQHAAGAQAEQSPAPAADVQQVNSTVPEVRTTVQMKQDKVDGGRHGCLIEREPDADGDGIPDARDAFPDDPTRW